MELLILLIVAFFADVLVSLAAFVMCCRLLDEVADVQYEVYMISDSVVPEHVAPPAYFGAGGR